MGCTLGRITGLGSPNSIRQDGDRLRLAGEFTVDTAAEGVALAQQLVGYPSPDEEVVPFTYDASASGGVLDGFYFVTSTRVDWAKLAAGLFSWEAELVAVPSKVAPLFSVSCLGSDRTNSHTLTGNGWVAIPGDSVSRSLPTATAATVSTIGSSVFYAEADALYSATVTYAATPGNHYDGAATLYVDDNEVTGRQALNGTTWEVSNGLVRVKPASNANQITVGVRNSGATAYHDKDYRFGYYTTEALELGYDGSTRNGWQDPIVLRNSPECVAIRTYMSVSGLYQFDGGGSVTAPASSMYLDLAIRRGAFWIDGRLVLDDGAGTTTNLGVWRSATEAGTSITGGIEATSADADSNKFRIYTPIARTADTTYGGLYATSARSNLDFAIGNNRAFSTFTVANSYFALMDHQQEVVAR